MDTHYELKRQYMRDNNSSIGINFGLLFIRIAVGAVFIVHGVQKLQGMEGTIGFFGDLGISPFVAQLVAYAEVIGGGLVLLGLFTAIGAFILSVVMLGAIYYVKAAMGFSGGYEFDLTLLMSNLALMAAGAGKFSLDAVFRRRE